MGKLIFKIHNILNSKFGKDMIFKVIGGRMLLYRVVIKKETKDYFIGKSYSDKKYKILKNEHIKNFNVGSDINFYARKEEGFFTDVLIPISDEEAGVKAVTQKVDFNNI